MFDDMVMDTLFAILGLAVTFILGYSAAYSFSAGCL